MPAPAKGRRKLKQGRAEETRDKILETARSAFAEHGYDGANVRDIACEAGTTHSMITYHFGTKDQLWREAVRGMFARIQRQVFEPMARDLDLPEEERYRRLIHRYARYCAEHPEHARITIAETIRGGDRLRWMVDEFVRPSHSAMQPLVTQLMDAGVIRRMPIESYVYALVGALQMPFVLATEAVLAMGYDFMSERAIHQHAETVLAMIMPAPRG